jgi:hypothetical protein
MKWCPKRMCWVRYNPKECEGTGFEPTATCYPLTVQGDVKYEKVNSIAPIPTTSFHHFPLEVRTHIRDYFYALRATTLVEKRVEALWNALKWESRNVSGWNILMNENYKLTSKVILRRWVPRGETAAKGKILAYCEKRLAFANMHTPTSFTGFERPRPENVRKNVGYLLAAIFGKPSYS